VVASNISSSAFFRVIEEVRPTLLIDEADTFLQGNDELRGILNAGYKKKTAFVVRVTNEKPSQKLQELRESEKMENGSGRMRERNDAPSSKHSAAAKEDKGEQRMSLFTWSPALGRSRLVKFSCWCPKAVASIGKLPDTLADRCVVIRMQRKTSGEECERVRNLDTTDLRRQCVRFVKDNAALIAKAQPDIPEGLNDRAADIWEPLFALADLAGDNWPKVAREAAVAMTAWATEMNPISSLLLDIAIAFVKSGKDRLATRVLLEYLNAQAGRPWAESRKGKPVTDLWLAQQLRSYGIRPKYMWIDQEHIRGYVKEEFSDTFIRYIQKAEAKAYLEELTVKKPEDHGTTGPQTTGKP
jgi:hypothetical protein